MTNILKLPANTAGRDFVVGDIHGAFDLVLRAMKRVEFDPAVDRLFATGDLIDRGEDSYRCVRFLAQPYVYAVKGNHEDMLLELYADGEPEQVVLKFYASRNGLGWWMNHTREERQQVLNAIRDLPLVIEVDTPRGTVGLVHADVPQGMSWPTFLAEIEAGNETVMKTALWGRDRIYDNDRTGVDGVGRVFVGHTPQWNGVRQFGNLYGIDTGAIYGVKGEEGHLTMANLLAQTQVLVTNQEPQYLVDLRETTSTTPFGNYQR